MANKIINTVKKKVKRMKREFRDLRKREIKKKLRTQSYCEVCGAPIVTCETTVQKYCTDKCRKLRINARKRLEKKDELQNVKA